MEYIDVAGDCPDYCRAEGVISDEIESEVGETDIGPFPRELAEYLAIMGDSLDMAKAGRFDKDTRMASDIAKAEDQRRIKVGPYIGKTFIYIARECPEYFAEITRFIRDRSCPFVEGEERSLANYAKYLPNRNLRIDVKEVLDIGDYGN